MRPNRLIGPGWPKHDLELTEGPGEPAGRRLSNLALRHRRCARGSSCARASCTTSSSVRASGSRPTARPTARWPRSS
eukprot:scaffold113666_cov69-Phaeocystis_antarctica.AAC.1